MYATTAERKTEAAHVVREAEVLCGEVMGEGVIGEGESSDSLREGGELDIAVIVNQHASLKSSDETPPPVVSKNTHTHTLTAVPVTIV